MLGPVKHDEEGKSLINCKYQKYNDIPKLKQNIFGYLYPFNEIQKEESTWILLFDFNSIINCKFIWVHKLSL